LDASVNNRIQLDTKDEYILTLP